MSVSSLFLRSAVLSLLAIPSLVAAQATPKAVVGPYTYQGCYNELIGVRLLPDSYTVSDAMTIEQCVEDCQGSVYMGLEYAGECWCANALYETPVLSESDSDCGLPCHGDETEICGDALKLSIYELTNDPFDDPTFTPTPTAAPSATETEAAPTTTDGAAATTTAEEAAATTTEEAAASTTEEAAASTTEEAAATTTTEAAATTTEEAAASTTEAAATTTEPAPVPTPSNALTVAGWDAVGCLLSTNSFASFDFVGTDSSLDIETCIAECSAAGYKFAGIHADSCYCAATLGSSMDSYITLPESFCNIPCPGNAMEACGGDLPFVQSEKRQSSIPASVILIIYGQEADSSPAPSSSSSTSSTSTTDMPTGSGSTTLIPNATSNPTSSTSTTSLSGTNSVASSTGGSSSTTSTPYPTTTAVHVYSNTTSAIMMSAPYPTTTAAGGVYTTTVVTSYVDVYPTGPVTITTTETLVLTYGAPITATYPVETVTKSYVQGGVTYSETLTLPVYPAASTAAGQVISLSTMTVVPTQYVPTTYVPVGTGMASGYMPSGTGVVRGPVSSPMPAATYMNGSGRMATGFGGLVVAVLAAVALF